MNYTPAASGGNSITYPIKQISLDLSNTDFTKLNTSPIELIAAISGFIICPIQFVIQYKNGNLLPNSTLWFGYESLLSANQGTSYCFINTFNLTNQRGAFTLTTRYFQNDISDTSNIQPLVIWDITDTNITFDQFYITITYIELPNLI